jgi:hypothetical protein
VFISKYIHTYNEKLPTVRAPRHFQFIYRVNTPTSKADSVAFNVKNKGSAYNTVTRMAWF